MARCHEESWVGVACDHRVSNRRYQPRMPLLFPTQPSSRPTSSLATPISARATAGTTFFQRCSQLQFIGAANPAPAVFLPRGEFKLAQKGFLWALSARFDVSRVGEKGGGVWNWTRRKEISLHGNEKTRRERLIRCLFFWKYLRPTQLTISLINFQDKHFPYFNIVNNQNFYIITDGILR